MKTANCLRERWVNFSDITVNNGEKDRFWIGFRELILADMSFILLILQTPTDAYNAWHEIRPTQHSFDYSVYLRG